MIDNKVSVQAAKWVREQLGRANWTAADLVERMRGLPPAQRVTYTVKELEEELEHGLAHEKEFMISIDLFLGAALVFQVSDIETLVSSWQDTRPLSTLLSARKKRLSEIAVEDDVHKELREQVIGFFKGVRTHIDRRDTSSRPIDLARKDDRTVAHDLALLDLAALRPNLSREDKAIAQQAFDLAWRTLTEGITS